MGLKTYLFFIALLHMKQSHQDSCMLTSMCPATKELWNQRSKTFNCTERGTNYTCMLNKENRLVEACMYENVVGKEIVGCPSITTCKDSPQIAPENHYTDCPEDIRGCPKWNHEPYTIFEMYKYPACFYSNKYEYAFLNILPTTTNIFDKTQRPTTDQSSATPVGLIIGITIAISVLLTLILVIVVLVLIKRCLRRKSERQHFHAEEENMTEIKNVTQNVTEEKQSSQPLLLGSERPHFNAEEENMTDIKDVTQNLTAEKQSTYSQPLLLGPADDENITDAVPKIAEENPTIYSQPFFSDSDVSFYGRLKRQLQEFSKDAVASISLQNIYNLPLELLFSKVKIASLRDNGPLGGLKDLLSTIIMPYTELKSPNDLFYKNGEPVMRIYMKGDAARGKTTYCLWLLRNWFHAQYPTGTKQLNEWENALGSFKFVFLIRLRDVEKSRASVIDMICYDVLKLEDNEYAKWVKNALKEGKYHCLIIIDGLDEWKPDRNVTNHSEFKGMPLLDDIDNCVIFISMRPWKYNVVAHNVKVDDRVIDILGLDKAGIELMTANLLTNHYHLDITKSTGKLKYDEMIHKIENETLGSLMEIPLLAVVCLKIWIKGEQIGKSLTRFYIEMFGMLIERAREKHEIDKLPDTSHNEEAKSPFSSSICKHPIVSNYISVLRKLGKLAYNWLLSGKNTLELYADTLVKELGITRLELDFSLNVGLLSIEEVDSILTRKVKVYFFHKSVQEFLGAIHIVDNEAIIPSFCEHLSCTKDILEIDNVLKFLSGLNPKMGSSISQHIANITSGDAEIREIRNYQSIIPLDISILQQMYALQVSCYKEFVYTQVDFNNTQTAVHYHVSDVCAYSSDDAETMRASAEILSHHNIDIQSLSLFLVSTDSKKGIPDSAVTHFLCKTKALQSLYVNGDGTSRTFYEISDRFSSLTALHLISITLTPHAVKTLHSALQSNKVIETLGLEYITCQENKVNDDEPISLSALIQVLPELPRLFSLRIQISNRYEKHAFLEALKRLSHLKSVEYHRTLPRDDEYDFKVLDHIFRWPKLHWLWLGHINLRDYGLKLSPEMKVLETLLLDRVTMSETEWYNFVQAIDDIMHVIHVQLYGVNIDKKSLLKVRSSEHCAVTVDEVDDKGNHNLTFIRIWPPSIRQQCLDDLLAKCLGKIF